MIGEILEEIGIKLFDFGLFFYIIPGDIANRIIKFPRKHRDILIASIGLPTAPITIPIMVGGVLCDILGKKIK